MITGKLIVRFGVNGPDTPILLLILEWSASNQRVRDDVIAHAFSTLLFIMNNSNYPGLILLILRGHKRNKTMLNYKKSQRKSFNHDQGIDSVK